MSGNTYITNSIRHYETSIREKEEENDLLEQEEASQRELHKQKSWATYYLKKECREKNNLIYSFLREHGGLFGLNDEQKNFYTQLISEKGSLFEKFTASRNSLYETQTDITSLRNRQFSNHLSIFNDTLSRGKFLNEQALYENMTSELG